MIKTILITAIGGDISQGVAAILRESRPGIRLVGTDVHRQHGGHLFVDFFEVIPLATDPGYLAALKIVIKKYLVDVLIPMSETELGALHLFDKRFFGVNVITSGMQVVEVGLDKMTTIQALENLGISVPWTVPVKKSEPLSYPCILKNRKGSGSRAVFIIFQPEDARYFGKQYPSAVFQEMLEPSNCEVTCAVYRRHDGEVLTLQMLRRLTGGYTGWAKIINDEPTKKMCAQIAVGLNLKGSMNIQLRLTIRGPRVFEINPRFSSTVLMRHRVGFTDVLWALDEVEGKSVNFPIIHTNQVMVRVQSAAVFEDFEFGHSNLQ